ncbi:VOC family protein [Oscillibacter sp.]|uniref:VOC family protein n=1 Tax=Oscillibacter sp. TaxID=1945593 RepID=UPI00261AAD01|nr:VOC family protein [Oscillibacter sp.]MDD3346121.1 VOC family protein [Oscillibacter sp.]
MNKHFRGLGHIGIYTADMDESIAFYEKIGASLLKRETLSTPNGEKHLALVDLGGVTLELIQSPTPVSMEEGCIPHFAVYVDDMDATAAAIRAAGVDTFLAPKKKVLPHLFGGLENWFFTGPSGEQIELLKML